MGEDEEPFETPLEAVERARREGGCGLTLFGLVMFIVFLLSLWLRVRGGFNP